MNWEGIGFTVELACGKRAYVGTLAEMAQREAAGIYGPDPCAEMEDRTNGHVALDRQFHIGDKREAALYYLVVPLLVILAVGGSAVYAVVRMIR